MAEHVNPQITDAITQANVKNLGDAPGFAMATVYQTLAQATGLAMQNAVTTQQQMNTLNTAVTTQGVNSLNVLDPGAIAKSFQETMTGNAFAEMSAELKTLIALFPQASSASNPQMMLQIMETLQKIENQLGRIQSQTS